MKSIPKNFRGVTVGELVAHLKTLDQNLLVSVGEKEEHFYSEHTSDIFYRPKMLNNLEEINLQKDKNNRKFILIDPSSEVLL